jgi:hypothetical protein
MRVLRNSMQQAAVAYEAAAIAVCSAGAHAVIRINVTRHSAHTHPALVLSCMLAQH